MLVFTVFVCYLCTVWRDVLWFVICFVFNVCVCALLLLFNMFVECCCGLLCETVRFVVCFLGVSVCLCVVLWFRKVVVC